MFGKSWELGPTGLTPNLPERWDFFREFVGNFRQKKGQICHENSDFKSWDWGGPLLGQNSQLLPKICFASFPSGHFQKQIKTITYALVCTLSELGNLLEKWKIGKIENQLYLCQTSSNRCQFFSHIVKIDFGLGNNFCGIVTSFIPLRKIILCF